MPDLVRELWPVIQSFAERGLGRAADAEDVAQEVFLKICSRASDFDRTRDGLSWAFGIASYEVMTVRRRHQRRRESGSEEETALRRQADTSPSQEESAIQAELHALVLAVAGALSQEDRRTLELVEGGERPSANDATLRKRKQRALHRFRTLWRRLYGDS